MDAGVGSSNSSSNSDTYRKRRDSYSAAMINENPTADESVSSEGGRRAETPAKSQQLVVQRGPKLPDDCSLESERWSVESSVLKRELTRTPSTDTSRSWNESIEMPEIFALHPELLGRLARCRCFLAAKLSISSECQCQCRCQCRCSQCQYHRRKLSSCSSRDHAFLAGYKRKESSYSVSTCQSILPPSSSGRNSVVSLCHEIKEEASLETRLAGEVIQRRHSDQTQSPRGCKIGRVDNRRLSEQTLERSRACPRSFSEKTAGISEPWPRLRNESRETDPLKETSPERNVADRSGQRKRKKDEALRDAASNERRRSSASITPKMMRRRFSEQLILEGGLGSIPDYEDLLEEPEEGEESLTAANARKKITLKRHYYPEGGWGRVIVLVATLVQLICHGVQLGSGVLLSSTHRQFQRGVEHAGRSSRNRRGNVLEIIPKISSRKSDAFVLIDFERCRICRKKSKTGSVKRQQESWTFPRCIRSVNHKDRFYGPGATVRGRRETSRQGCNLKPRIVASRQLGGWKRFDGGWKGVRNSWLRDAEGAFTTPEGIVSPLREICGEEKRNPLSVEKVSENSSIGISKTRHKC
ncbi:hypothetical protein K0M31_003842 [Melipona bicolor]|uniref:Uncharacterized protein n=1 Tax=Melipona bicolor TaxID=60889 RepID=A0AA40FXN3_9HYME|nr:hypothetical protein K0M31_003842 [Melipona bicolor]